MLTRKKQKLQNAQMSLQFDPILESVSQFFGLRDCANVSKLNRAYHSKTWMNILNSSHRLLILNNVINLDSNSINWISKYRLHLKHQKIRVLHVSDKFDFDLSVIPQLLSLNVYTHISHFPVQVKELALWEISNLATFPNVTGVELLFLPRYYNFTKSLVLKTCPQTIKHIKIKALWDFNCQDLPNVPNLETLFLRAGSIQNVGFIREKFPNLEILHIVSNNALNNPEELALFQHKLVIESDILRSTQVFANFKCRELDISQCTHIHDFSGIAHIPIVKRFEKK
jgi:hypothetical protein